MGGSTGGLEHRVDFVEGHIPGMAIDDRRGSGGIAAGEGVDDDRSRGPIVARDVAEQELGMRAHLAERHDDVARLERSRRRLRE